MERALQCTGGQRTVVQRSEDRIQELLFEAVSKEHVDQDVNEPIKHAQAHCSDVLHSATPLEADATNPASACDRRIATVGCCERGTDNAVKGTNIAVKGTDNALQGTDNAVKGTDNAVKITLLRVRITL